MYWALPHVLASCCHLSLCTLISLPVSSAQPSTLYQNLLNSCLLLHKHNYEDTWCTVSWSFSILGKNWRDFRKCRRGPHAPEPAAEGDFEMEYSSDQLYSPSIVPARTYVTVATVWKSEILDNPVPVRSCGCQITGFLLYWQCLYCT